MASDWGRPPPTIHVDSIRNLLMSLLKRKKVKIDPIH